MDEQSKKLLKKILEKDINDLTEHDYRFLRARRDYLNDKQIEMYLEDIKEQEPVKVTIEKEDKPDTIVKTITQEEFTKEEIKNMSYLDLYRLVNEKGIKMRRRPVREDLEKLYFNN